MRAYIGLALLFLAGTLSPWKLAPLQAAPLRDGASTQGKLIGTAVDMNPFRNEADYRTTLGREFNMLAAENAMKFDAIHPTQNTHDFTAADELVAYAEANAMAVRGHVLIWHSQNPTWLMNGNFNREQMIAIMQDHIAQVVGRYRGRIAHWDVVNEAISDNNGQPRDSIWRQRIGPDYIEIAFRAARAADPTAKLYYNDYEAEGAGAKSDAVFKLVSDLVSNGVPIDGVGWQWHKINGVNAAVTSAHVSNAARIANLGLELMITEADVRIQLPGTGKLQAQANEYASLWNFCLNTAICRGVVTWGFTDKYSWVPPVFSGFGEALIFDTSYQPKPAYTVIDDLLRGVQSQTLTVNKGGTGTVISIPGGINCGTPCTTQNASFAKGTNVTLTASAASGSTFAGWSGACTGTAACAVAMTQARTVTATFNTSTDGNGGGVTVSQSTGGSPPYYFENRITVSNTAAVTAMTITVVVQRTTGVTSPGLWDNVGTFQQTNTGNSNPVRITYVWTLSRQLEAGSGRQFVAQSHGNGAAHPTSGDTWTVSYTTGGQNFTQTGTF